MSVGAASLPPFSPAPPSPPPRPHSCRSRLLPIPRTLNTLTTSPSSPALPPLHRLAEHFSFGCSDATFSPSSPYWRQARHICVFELLAQQHVAIFKTVRSEETAQLIRGSGVDEGGCNGRE